MPTRITAVVRLLSEWDTAQERTAHPWWTPRGLLFWWVWRPAAIAVVLGLIGLAFWIPAEVAKSLFGADRATAAGLGGLAVTIWFLWMMRRSRF